MILFFPNGSFKERRIEKKRNILGRDQKIPYGDAHLTSEFDWAGVSDLPVLAGNTSTKNIIVGKVL
jgi:hypothetical protein